MFERSNPLTETQEDFAHVLAHLETCPECGEDVDVVDLTDDGDIFVHHVGDDIPGLEPNPQHTVEMEEALEAI